MRRAFFQFIEAESGDTVNVAVDAIVSYGYHVEKAQTSLETATGTVYCVKDVSQQAITDLIVAIGSEHHIL